MSPKFKTSNTNMEERLVFVIGGGGHAKQVIEAFLLSGYSIGGIFDDCCHDSSSLVEIQGCPLLGPIAKVAELPAGTKLHCAIGDNRVREEIFGRFPSFTWENAVHPNAYISSWAKLGDGNYVGGGARILPSAKIGRGNIINELCAVSHDCVVGDFNHLSVHSCLLGRSGVGNLCLVGGNATVNPSVVLGNNVILGAGGVATRPFLCGTFVGVPARPIPGWKP